MTQDTFLHELAPLVRAALAGGPLNVTDLHRELRQSTPLRVPPRHLLVDRCAQLHDVAIDRVVDHRACRISARIQLVAPPSADPQP